MEPPSLETSHWINYKDNMYSTTNWMTKSTAYKPMKNCPGQRSRVRLQAARLHDLPIRAGEMASVQHRHELKGALHGLFRVRCFDQDDAHLFVTPEQLHR